MFSSETNKVIQASLTPATTPERLPLALRLLGEIETARERVEALQIEAASGLGDRNELLLQFPVVAERIQVILQARLDTMTDLLAFQEIRQQSSPVSAASAGGSFQSRMTTLTLPASASLAATMTCSFRVGHDLTGTLLILGFRLDIQPVFIKFQTQDQLILPIAEIPEATVSAWIEEKLVGLTKTYFETFCHGEHQKQYLVLDPVLNIRFPQAMAAGTQHYQGHTHYFYSDDSFQLFCDSPEEYTR